MIVFDCEVQPPTGNIPTEMSICAWWNSENSEIRFVEWMYVDEFVIEATDTDVIVGFNCGAGTSVGWDYRLFVNMGFTVDDALQKTFDLERSIWYEITQGDYTRKVGKIDLDTLGQVNLQRGKIPLEATPARLYEEGFVDLVGAYCMNDVRLTRDLLFHAIEYGFLDYLNEDNILETVETIDFEERIDILAAQELGFD